MFHGQACGGRSPASLSEAVRGGPQGSSNRDVSFRRRPVRRKDSA